MPGIDYPTLAQNYAAGVRQLLFPTAGAEAAERGAPTLHAPADLVFQAQGLAALSQQLTTSAANRLADPDDLVRQQASEQLLAKALADLEVSAFLLQAAQDEELKAAEFYRSAPPEAALVVERSAAALTDLEGYLDILTAGSTGAAFTRGAPQRGGTTVEDALPLPASLPIARQQLTQSTGDTLALVLEKAAKTGQSALSGLLGLGAAELAQAAGVVGLDIARALGAAEKVTQLYQAFRSFVVNAYNSILALLGPTMAGMATQQVVVWVNDLLQGEKLKPLVEKLYRTAETQTALGQQIETSQAALEKFILALQGINSLQSAYQKQLVLVEKLLKGLNLLAGIPASAFPQGRVLMAAAYIILAGYVFLAGADYVDAPKAQKLGRLPGVRKVVEGALVG